MSTQPQKISNGVKKISRAIPKTNHERKISGIKMQSLFVLLTIGALVLGGFFVHRTRASAVSEGDVIINEFSSASATEWVELLNTTDNPISLEEWVLTDLAGHSESLSGLGTIPANGILVFERSSGWLNNVPDEIETITLLDNTSTSIHSVSYGPSPEAIVEAPAAGESAIFVAPPSTWTISSSTKGWFNDAGGEGKAPLLSDIDTALSAPEVEIESNIGELGNPSNTPSGEEGLYFKKIGKGKIVFTSSLNLSDETTVAVLQNLGAAMEIISGHVAFNSTTTEAMKATGAKIYMYGLDELGYESEPTIIVKNDANEIIDGTDIVSGITYMFGGLNGGEISFDAAHFTQFDLEEQAVNTPPSFDPIMDQSIDEDSPSQEVLITNITPGNESDQIVTITAVSSDSMIVLDPQISGDGATRTLTYTPVTDANGAVVITVTADDGRAENNTFSRTFTITVNPVEEEIFGSEPSIPVLHVYPSPTRNTQPTLTWDTVMADPPVSSYEIEIYDSSEENIYGMILSVIEPFFILDSSLDDDKYSWYVRAQNPAGYSFWSEAGNFTIDTIAPTVTNLGDGAGDYSLPFLREELFGVTMAFSEKLSVEGRAAVENALTAGADKSLTFKWNDNNGGDGTKIRMSVSGSETVAFANDVLADVTDLAGNTATELVLIDSIDESVTNERTGEKYATIQSAIDNASEGDTISVASGEYKENLNIDIPITLVGNIGDEAIGPAENAPIITDNGSCENRIISVEANNVTVKGFVLNGNGCGKPVVRIGEEISGVEISENDVSGGRKGVDLSPHSNENIVTNNKIHGNDNHGIWIGGSTNNTISNNEIYDNATGIGLGEGGCDNECVGNISGNNVTGNHIYENEEETSGIHIGGDGVSFETLTISNNNIAQNSGHGIYVAKVAGGKLTVSGNTIQGNWSSGIYIVETDDASETTIGEKNIIKNNNSAGIYLGNPVSGVTIIRNTIQDNGVKSERTGIVTLSALGNKARNNIISGNGSIEVSNEDENPENIFDAKENWWGTPSSTEIEAKINGSVDFTPWYMNLMKAILSSAVSGKEIDATKGSLDFDKTSDGAVGMPSGTSEIKMGDNSLLDFSSSLNAVTSGEVVIGGTRMALANFALGDTTVVDLSTPQIIGGKTVAIEKAIKLTSGVADTPIILTNTAISNASVSIPDGTTILAPSGWTGSLKPPKSGSTSGAAPSGFSVGGTVIEVGSSDAILLFDKPVTLTLSGVTGQVGYKPSGEDSAWTQITNTCAGTYASPANPAFPGECAITNGTDTKILTYHFTTFGSLVAASTPRSALTASVGTTGGGGAVTTPSPANPVAKKADANQDGKVDIFDFNALMVQWGKKESGNSADFNGDEKIDIFDFNVLMINWTF